MLVFKIIKCFIGIAPIGHYVCRIFHIKKRGCLNFTCLSFVVVGITMKNRQSKEDTHVMRIYNTT